MSTINDISVWYEILHEGRGEQVDEAGCRGRMRFKVNWKDRWSFYRDVAGRVTTTQLGSAGSISRIVPLQYPDNPWMYACGMDTTPVGQSRKVGSEHTWDFAFIDVDFETRPFNMMTGDFPGYQGSFRTESIEMSSESLVYWKGVLKSQNYKTSGGSAWPLAKEVYRIVPTASITITQEYCPWIPYGTIFSLLGRVNSQPFYGCAPGTVFFDGAGSESQFSFGTADSERLVSQRVTLKFRFRPIPWNMFLCPDGSFDYFSDERGKMAYQVDEFNRLFFDYTDTPEYLGIASALGSVGIPPPGTF